MWCALFLCGVLPAVYGAPHVVVIIADDMGWNDVSFHGSSQIMTPNIDALAYAGVILNRHYTLPTCSPSRSALLTGKYPVHTGLQYPLGAGATGALSLDHTILPQHLRRLGYKTHLVGKWHLGCHRSEYLPTHRGFDSHFGFWNGYVGYFDGIHERGQTSMAGMDARRDEAEAWQEFVGHYVTDIFTQEAVSIVKKHDSAKGPMFLQVALSAPHTGNIGEELQVRDLAANERRNGHIDELARRLYAGMVQGVDDSVGAILEALRSRDMLNESIVLFFSDNGAPTLDPIWGYNNHGSNWPLRGMKISCHEGGVRTAAVLWSPLVVGGRVSQQLIHVTDWLPTIYSAAGGDLDDLGKLDGVNQWEQLRGKQNQTNKRTELLVDLDPISGNEALIQWPWKIIKYSNNPELNGFAGDSGRGLQYPVDQVSASAASLALSMKLSASEVLAIRAQATIDSRCPLVVNNGTTVVQPCTQNYCLFNLLSDPCESTDLSRSYPSVVAVLQDSLNTYRQSMVPRTPSFTDPRSDPSLWHNYWAPWADDIPNRARLHTSFVMLLVCPLLVATVSV